MKYVDVAAVILAAGKGTRMKSDLPKVLHTIDSKSMISYVTECAVKVVGEKNIHIVVGHQAQKVKKEIDRQFDAVYAYQKNMFGTGDAVKAALQGLPDNTKTVLVLNGDVPFVKAKTLLSLINTHMENRNSITLLTIEIDDPTGYGRIIQDDKGSVICIKEQADATFEEKKIKKINSGIYCFDREFLEYAIPKIESNNVQKEYYLTDVMEIAIAQGARTGLISADNWREVIGVNTIAELERAQGLLKEIDL
ncbi:MAG: NTP transferase domain-containing protein [Desulfobacterales bacterium]|nr:NTP transferase domain-containing protein [Desulfobacterales bacterium]